MSNTKAGINEAIKKANARKKKGSLAENVKRERGVSGKDKAAGEKEDAAPAPKGPGRPKAPEKPYRMANWAIGETKIVKVGDRALLKLAATAVKGAAKRAKSLNAGLDIAKGKADDRINEAQAILTALKSADNRANITVPGHLLRCAQVGVSFEIDKAVKAKEHEVEDLLVEDTRGIDKHLGELERLARDLGMQGDLFPDADDEDEEDEKKPDDQEELDVD